MAFNFNWSPLIADTDRVRHMLTTALNKSPKPPIIVDDILVNELNLGSTPPQLEILEIGDLAEDRFRGIFKMSYTGDAYLTLKTRVQANPLNTYLSTKPTFASPQPLAASSSLTIPLQITLSDIRLSGFVILVFSKQKGITLVFRNDPLESLKVSSTFDSIPFVRDYLQKTIENQLRVLFMEDLPAIIHKLSLRLFSPEHQAIEDLRQRQSEAESKARVDPFAGPAEEAVDSDGFSLDPPTETYASFSQKNLLRLAALSESQRTLSLFTPSIRDTVYRAWASAGDRDMSNGVNTPTHRTATLSRIQSSVGFGKPGTWSSTTSEHSDAGSHASRPSLTTMASAPTVYSLGSGRPRPHGQRKRKNRVVNLRKKAVEGDTSDVASVPSSYEDSATSDSRSTAPSIPVTQPTSQVPSLEREGELSTPPQSPKKKVGWHAEQAHPHRKIAHDRPPSSHSQPSAHRPVTPRHHSSHPIPDDDPTPRQSTYLPVPSSEPEKSRHPLPRTQTLPTKPAKHADLQRSASDAKLSSLGSPFGESGTTGGILEQAWMLKISGEVARRLAEEKAGSGKGWRRKSSEGLSEADEAPPAYVS